MCLCHVVGIAMLAATMIAGHATAWAQEPFYNPPHHNPFKCEAAIVCGGQMFVSGASSYRVYWGLVVAKGDITLSDLRFAIEGRFPPRTLTLTASTKARGAGILYDGGTTPGMEQWLRWHTAGVLRNPTWSPIFPDIEGVTVTDFFSQVMNGAFPGYPPAQVDFLGNYNLPDIASGLGILYDAPVGGSYPEGSGALVQHEPSVSTFVDAVLHRYDRDSMMDDALVNGIWHNHWYVRLTADGHYVDADGYQYYVTPAGDLTTDPAAPGAVLMESLSQLSRHARVPPDGRTAELEDELLIVEADLPSLTFSLGGRFFWKGCIRFVNSQLDLMGIPGATVLMQPPDMYDPESPIGWLVNDCVVDGILAVDGGISRTGNSTIYGSLVSRVDLDAARTPPVYAKYGRMTGTRCHSSVQSGDWGSSTTWCSESDSNRRDIVRINDPHVIDVGGTCRSDWYVDLYGTLRLTSPTARLGVHQVVLNGAIEADAGVLEWKCGGGLINNGTLSVADDALLRVSGFGDAVFAGQPFSVPNVLVESTLSLQTTMTVTRNMAVGVPVFGFTVGRIWRAPYYAPGAGLTYRGLADEWPSVLYSAMDEWPVGRTVDKGTPTSVTLTAGSRVQLGAGDRCTSDLTIEQGSLLRGPQGQLVIAGTLRIDDGTLFETDTTSMTQGLDHVVITSGTITHRCGIVTTGSYDFGLALARVDIVQRGAIQRIDLSRREPGMASTLAGIQSDRNWQIAVVYTSEPYQVSLTLPHAGLTDPYICRTTDGVTWHASRSEYTSDTVTLHNIADLGGTWAVGDAAVGPVPVALSVFHTE